MIHAIHAVVVVVHTRWLEHLLSVMHHWHFNHLCRTGWAEHYEHLILSSALYAVTNSCSHLKDKWSPRLSENDFALIMSGRSMQFFMTVPVKEVLWEASDCITGMLAQYRSVYMMAAIEVTPHKVHDNRTRLREWLRFWASSFQHLCTLACQEDTNSWNQPCWLPWCPIWQLFFVHMVWHQNDHKIQPWFHQWRGFWMDSSVPWTLVLATATAAWSCQSSLQASRDRSGWHTTPKIFLEIDFLAWAIWRRGPH